MNFEKNQLITVDIVDMTSEGEGLGKLDGFPFFVKDTVIGDQALVRIVKLKKNYGYGRLEKVIRPASCRREPKSWAPTPPLWLPPSSPPSWTPAA